jgi:uncharacterized FlaG/YvyC family protein
MNKQLFILLFAGLFVFACSQNSTEKSEEKKEESDTSKTVKKKGPRKLETVKTSELAQLMRLMDKEMQSAKISIEGGFSYHDSLTFDYGNIHSAMATEENMKKPGFDEFASAYLKQLEILKKSGQPSQKQNFNLLVNSCLNCHASHCPGPINKIKELRIKN